MSRLNALRFLIAISLGVTLFGVCAMGLYSDLASASRLYMVEVWEWVANLVALALAALCLWCWASPTVSTGDKVYRRMIPTTPSGVGDTVIVYQTPGTGMAMAGALTLALGLTRLVGHPMVQRPPQIPFTVPAYIMISVSVLVIVSRYTAVVDVAGGRLLQTFSALGLGLTRRADFSSSAKVRLREEITLSGRSSGRLPLHSLYLEVVDGDKVIPISTSGSRTFASNLAGQLQKSEYEHLICDFTGCNAPADAKRLLEAPLERVSALSPRIAVLCLLLCLVLPRVYLEVMRLGL